MFHRIAIGAKRIETRSWGTSFRGRLAIHAAKGLGPVGGKRGLIEQCDVPAFAHALREATAIYGNHENPFPLGALVATAHLVDVRRVDTSLRAHVLAQTITPNEIEFGNYETGRFAWFLENVKALPEPIECSGALSLWNVPAEVLTKIAVNAVMV